MHIDFRRLIGVVAFAALSLLATTALAQSSGAPAARQPARAAAPAQRPVRQASADDRQPATGARNSDEQTAPARKPQPKEDPLAPAKPALAVMAPFQLTETQQQLLDQVLLKWEKQSDKVKTFKCTFRRWDYDPTWGPKPREYQIGDAAGVIMYAAPDFGVFQILKMTEYDAGKQVYTPRKEGLDYWLCDGNAIFEFNFEKKQLIERRLPPELHGKAISDGPLPFIFGAKAEQLKRRYWMRDMTPKEYVGKEIWLEAWPKSQQDAANFQRATVVLNDSDFMPLGLQIILPGIQNKDPNKPPANQAYSFEDSKINGLFAKVNFPTPALNPAQKLNGWKHVVIEPGSETPAAPPADAKQAKRKPTAIERK